MKKLLATMFTAVVVAMLTACGTARNAASQADALNGEWRITRVGDMTVNTQDAEKEAYLGFNSAEKQMNGCAGCNRIFGPYTTGDKAGSISFSNVASTRMMCADMSVEDKVLEAMGKVAAFKIKGGKTLTLKDAAGESLIVLKKK